MPLYQKNKCALEIHTNNARGGRIVTNLEFLQSAGIDEAVKILNANACAKCTFQRADKKGCCGFYMRVGRKGRPDCRAGIKRWLEAEKESEL